MKELFNTAYLIYLWQTYADMGRVLGEDRGGGEGRGGHCLDAGKLPWQFFQRGIGVLPHTGAGLPGHAALGRGRAGG